MAEFEFLGKDSVPWHKELELPPVVYETLAELIRDARPSSSAGNGDEFHPTKDLPQIFPDIHSRNVNGFLSRIHKGLTAKVFRTHHATAAVQASLASSRIKAGDPEFKKWHAAVMANLEAAVLCNHTKKYNGDWESTSQRYQERLEKAEARREKYVAQLAEREETLQILLVEASAQRSIARANVEKIDPGKEKQLERARARYDKVVERYERRVATAKKSVAMIQERITRAEQAIGKIRAQFEVSGHKRTWNLSTSLKSYIDPRVYYAWGQSVGYDVIEKYYPTTLRRKFAWVQENDDD
jgi:DNA topoisomerase-1